MDRVDARGIKYPPTLSERFRETIFWSSTMKRCQDPLFRGPEGLSSIALTVEGRPERRASTVAEMSPPYSRMLPRVGRCERRQMPEGAVATCRSEFGESDDGQNAPISRSAARALACPRVWWSIRTTGVYMPSRQMCRQRCRARLAAVDQRDRTGIKR